MSNDLSEAESKNAEKSLHTAIAKLLRPLTRLLLRHGMPYNVFAEIARQSYVDVATQEFTLPGRQQSVSRVSVLTGINRKDITKMLKKENLLESLGEQQLNRASRVVNGWLSDERFLDSQGKAKVLPLEGEEVSFSTLVRFFSGDVPVRALLDELIRIKSVSIDSDENVTLHSRAYVPCDAIDEKLRIFGNAAADHLNTITHNLDVNCEEPRYQRSVAYANIPVESLPSIRLRCRDELQGLLSHINSWLRQHDRDVNQDELGSGKVRAGIGLYYFEEDQEGES